MNSLRCFVAAVLCCVLALSPCQAFADTTPTCIQPETKGVQQTQSTAAEMTDVLCKAAEDGRYKPASENLFAACGAGAAEGARVFFSNLAGFASSIGTGIADVASSGYQATKSLVLSLWNGEPDPAIAAEKAATANAEASRSWLQTVASYYDTSKLLMETFYNEMDQNFRLIYGTMACVPWSLKVQSACLFMSHVALDLGSLKAVTLAANRGAAAARVVSDFIKTTDGIAQLRGTSLATRLQAATEALKAQSGYKVVEKFGDKGNLVTRIDPITREQTLHFEELATVDGKKVTVIRDIPKDAKTGAIDANFENGKKLAILSDQGSVGEHMVFLDVNNLGKVNYFKSGTQAGDEYLKRVGDAVRRQLREGDRFFKNGGDELVVILKTKDPAEVKKIEQRIHDAIASDKPLQDLFKQERIAKAAEVKQANSVGPGAKPSPPTEAQIASLLSVARIRPSVSIGAARIQGDWATDLARAESQAGQVKAAYKARIGLETGKYGDRLGDVGDAAPTLMAQPEVLDPIQ